MKISKYKTETHDRKSVYMELSQIDVLSQEGSFMELTIWTNGEGFDCTIDDLTVQYTWEQLKALKLLASKLKSEINYYGKNESKI